MKCPACGADNPDYTFYCGKCAAELRSSPQREPDVATRRRPQSETKIETVLSRNLLRIENNASRNHKGFFGRLKGSFGRSGTMVFRSEREEVTLIFDGDGHASVSRGRSAKPTIELVGPHESFLDMFGDERNVDSIPDPISVRLLGREMPDEASQQVFRSGIERLLHGLFE